MIIKSEDLAQLRQKYEKKRIVLGCGVFDLLHYGQVQYLQQLKQYGDIVVVGVRSDVGVQRFKGDSRPIIPETDRAAMIDALKGVDYTIILPYEMSTEDSTRDVGHRTVIELLKPDVLVVANNEWKSLKDDIKTEMIILPRAQGHFDSTTAIIERIKQL